MEPKPICLLTRDSYEVSQTFTYRTQHNTHTHTHIHLTALFPGLPGWASTRKVKPIWILLKQETVSGSGISWAMCKSASRSRQITTPAPHCSVFFTGQMPFLPPNQQRQSMHANRDNFDSISFLFCHYPSLRHVPQKRMICIFIAIFQVHIS